MFSAGAEVKQQHPKHRNRREHVLRRRGGETYWEHDGAAYLRDQKVRREVLCPLSEAASRYPDKLREVLS